MEFNSLYHEIFEGPLSPVPSDCECETDAFRFKFHPSLSDFASTGPSYFNGMTNPFSDVRRLPPHGFKAVERIDATVVSEKDLLAKVHSHVVTEGRPLVLSNYHKFLEFNKSLFSPSWLRENRGSKKIEARNVKTRKDEKMSLAQYLDYMAEARTTSNSDSIKLLYGKDILCPREWKLQIERLLPEYFAYHGNNDLSSSLPAKDRAKNLMLYIGIAGTKTPAHKDMCGSFGHNLMVYAAENAYSVWYMIESGDKDKAERLFKDHGKNLDFESFIASEETLSKADFPVYWLEQRVGDFILVPSEGCHQVFNHGGCTIKISWNRVIAETMKVAMESALPTYQAVCRPETYKMSRMLMETVRSWTAQLKKDQNAARSKDKKKPVTKRNPLTDYGVRDIRREFSTLLCQYKKLVEREWVDDDLWEITKDQVQCEKYHVTCDFCQSDIFNRFFRCDLCHTANGTRTYDICGSCYAAGRGCSHRMIPFQSFSYRELEEFYRNGQQSYFERWGVTVLDIVKQQSSTGIAYHRWSNSIPSDEFPTSMSHETYTNLIPPRIKKIRNRKCTKTRPASDLMEVDDAPPTPASPKKRKSDQDIDPVPF